jgi:Fe2+ transport system protein FeoA
MTGTNQLEKGNFHSLIENDGIEKVKDRLNIIDAFLDTEEHVTLKELIALLRERGFDGEKFIIKDMKGGKTALARLTSMGFHQGEVLEVINNDGHGRLILGRDYMRLAVGRGLAQKIMVTLAP